MDEGADKEEGDKGAHRIEGVGRREADGGGGHRGGRSRPDDIESLGVIFVDPSAYSNPRLWHEKAARIRAESPILKVSVEGYPSFWAITTHADVLEIERNHDIFTNAPLPVLGQLQGDADPEGAGVKTLVQMDGEEHRSHRLVVNDWFKPAAIKKLTDKVDRLAKDSVDHMAHMGGTCDFMNDVAVPFR